LLSKVYACLQIEVGAASHSAPYAEASALASAPKDLAKVMERRTMRLGIQKQQSALKAGKSESLALNWSGVDLFVGSGDSVVDASGESPVNEL
jgi:hypothetical protein